jgi:hypothetical protein
MWYFCYTALSGISAFYLAKWLKKNPYFWAIIACLFKFKVFFLLFLSFQLLRAFFSRSIHKNKKNREENVISATELDTKAQQSLWYYLDGEHRTQGPVSLRLLLQKWQEGAISASTNIWNETMEEWKTITEVFPHGGHVKRSSF